MRPTSLSTPPSRPAATVSWKPPLQPDRGFRRMKKDGHRTRPLQRDLDSSPGRSITRLDDHALATRRRLLVESDRQHAILVLRIGSIGLHIIRKRDASAKRTTAPLGSVVVLSLPLLLLFHLT